ncbi:hypothetical protein J4Q44_G00243660 [Coregonus suidteri]|uniref:Uncharacterized protein n=1 Tax=Coregonus suidteri TaxID=861788 RepID=A0AAN8QN49_9TELE
MLSAVLSPAATISGGIIIVSWVLEKYVPPANRLGFVYGDTSWGIGYCSFKRSTASTRDLGFHAARPASANSRLNPARVWGNRTAWKSSDGERPTRTTKSVLH